MEAYLFLRNFCFRDSPLGKFGFVGKVLSKDDTERYKCKELHFYFLVAIENAKKQHLWRCDYNKNY